MLKTLKQKKDLNEKIKMPLWRYRGRCKCSKNFEKILRCNCSLCKRKGALMSMVKNEDFKIIKGEDKLKIYQFHTRVAKHYFCSNCGIYTHHNPRSNPAMTGFNLGCLDDVDTLI